MKSQTSVVPQPSSLLAVLLGLFAPIASGQGILAPAPQIVSAWKLNAENAVITLRGDGTYCLVEDAADSKGMEFGRFTWDAATGVFSAVTEVDTNGEHGLSHPSGTATVAISGDTMTYSTPGNPAATLTRVLSSTNPIVGSWFSPGERVMVTFLADGTYYHAEQTNDAPFGYDGIERGTYTWNSTSGALTTTPVTDLNGDVGPGSISGATASIAGNFLTLNEGTETFKLEKVVTNTIVDTLPQDFANLGFMVDKFANYIQTSDAPPLLSAVEPFWGEAWIEFSGLLSPTLKIGNQAELDFVDEGDGYSIETNHATEADLITAFPNAVSYVFKSGTSTATLTFPPSSAFPNVPKWLGTDGSWVGGTYHLGPNDTFVWTGQSNYSASNRYSLLSIYDPIDQVDLLDGYPILGNATSFDLRGKLVPGRDYWVTIEHLTIAGTTTSGTGVFSGKKGFAELNSNTSFQVRAYSATSEAPSIYHQPASTSVAQGGRAIFSAGISDAAWPVPTCQWRKGGVALPGQTGNSLVIDDVQLDDVGDYSVVVTNSVGVASSDPATLTLAGNPQVSFVLVRKDASFLQTAVSTIIVDPTPVSPLYGGAYGFSINVQGTDLAVLTAPTVTPPIGTPDTTQDRFYSTLFYNTEDSSWNYGPNANDWGATSQAEIDRLFPNGTYTIQVAGTRIPLTLTGNAYPNTPQLTLTGGAWINGKYAMDAANALNITSNRFDQYGTAVMGHIGFWANDFETEFFSNTSPASNFVSHTISANTLPTNQISEVGVDFDNVTQANSVMGSALAIATYSKTTTVQIHIIPKILSRSADAVVSPGSQKTLQVDATGSPVSGSSNMNYQWMKNGIAISGATARSMVLDDFQIANAGYYTCTVSNDVGVASSGPILVELADAYQSYVQGYGLNSVTSGMPNADYDSDGVSNLLEFVLGGNPTVAGSSILPTAGSIPAGGGRNLVFQYLRKLAASGISQQVEYSMSLTSSWIPAVHNQAGVTIATQTVDSTTERVTVTIPVVGTKAFARLKATR